MRIVNGRLCEDKGKGKFTCFNYFGSSVVDYLLTNYADFPIINTFKVGDITEFSKHVPITFCLNCVKNDVNVNCEMPTKRIIWKNEDVEAFKCEIRSTITDIENVINDIDNPGCNVYNIDDFSLRRYDVSYTFLANRVKRRHFLEEKVRGLTRNVNHVKQILIGN